jgi:hypothetical protein
LSESSTGTPDPGDPEDDIRKAVRRFKKKSLSKQRKEYLNLRKTYQKHLEKYGQEPGRTTGEVNRIERQLRHYEWILKNRGQF